MDWLMHNPIADMRGPNFLLFYAVVGVLTIIGCAWLALLRDPTRLMSAPSIPPQVDPYEVAYLRGGTNEVIRMVILDLIQRGYLQREIASDRICRSGQPPDARHLTTLERVVFNWFYNSRGPKEVFDGQLKAVVDLHCAAYAERLNREHLLLPAGAERSKYLLIALGLAVILGLGGYKFVVALLKGRTNVGFLLAMGIGFTIVHVLITHRVMPRASKRGRDYLKKLQHAFEQFKSRVRRSRSSSESEDLLMLASVFGIGVLEGTAYGYYPKMFRKAESSSSGCGSSCGSGCGLGCGGGGGCGGCGGG